MLPLFGAILGALFGAWRAQRARGNRLDIAQYAAVYAMIFALVGLIAALILARAG